MQQAGHGAFAFVRHVEQVQPARRVGGDGERQRDHPQRPGDRQPGLPEVPHVLAHAHECAAGHAGDQQHGKDERVCGDVGALLGELAAFAARLNSHDGCGERGANANDYREEVHQQHDVVRQISNGSKHARQGSRSTQMSSAYGDVVHWGRLTRGVFCVVLAVLLGAVGLTTASQAQQAEQFSLVVLPDTQIYLDDDSPQPESGAIFQAQVDWLVENAASENVVFTTHVGDVVQNPERASEWDRVDPMLRALDDAGVPYAVAAGNHDLEPGTDPGLFDQYLPPSRWADTSWYGGYHDESGNRASFQRITVGDRRLLFVHLRHLDPQFGDPTAMLGWAADVLAAHPAHVVFVTTHEFTDPDGLVIFPDLVEVVQDSCNVAAIFSGHKWTAARGTFTDSCDRTVHHMLTNYQNTENGGNGFMRQLVIDAETLDAVSTVFSPLLGTERTGPAEQFMTTLSEPSSVFGDVDQSGAVDDLDVVALLETLVGSGPAAFDGRVADIDGDDVLSVADALLLTS